MQPWNEFWPEFLERERLLDTIQELDLLDRENQNTCLTEDICRGIYEEYDARDEARLKKVRHDFLQLLDDIKHVHLSTSRVKNINSILRKIIIKRHQNYRSRKSAYSTVTLKTYGVALTDLVGVRVILSYRGDWINVHQELLKLFPMRDRAAYHNGILPHEPGQTFMAEWPKVYHAAGDRVDSYKQADLEIHQHKKGYRSIHYTISYCNTYIELQVRTIYDEAWSDVDHRYVYKQEANPSSEALSHLSSMLCQLTNLSNDVGEQMRAVFDGERMSKINTNSNWRVSRECKDFFLQVTERLQKCHDAFEEMCARMETDD